MKTRARQKKAGGGKPRMAAKPIEETLFGLTQKDICRIAQEIIDRRRLSSMSELEEADYRIHTLISSMGLSRELRFAEDE